MIDKNSVKFVSVPIVLRKLNDYNIGTFGLKITYEIKENGALLSKKTKDYYLSKFLEFELNVIYLRIQIKYQMKFLNYLKIRILVYLKN